MPNTGTHLQARLQDHHAGFQVGAYRTLACPWDLFESQGGIFTTSKLKEATVQVASLSSWDALHVKARRSATSSPR